METDKQKEAAEQDGERCNHRWTQMNRDLRQEETSIKKRTAGGQRRRMGKKTGLVSQGVTEKPGEFSN